MTDDDALRAVYDELATLSYDHALTTVRQRKGRERLKRQAE